MKKLTKEQKLRIYCIKHGHADYIFKCWGYIHCGRCEEQIGDQLGGVFDTSKLMELGHKCKMCNAIRKKQKKFDLKIIEKWEKKNE